MRSGREAGVPEWESERIGGRCQELHRHDRQPRMQHEAGEARRMLLG